MRHIRRERFRSAEHVTQLRHEILAGV
jgi:hypothetical protein